MGNLINKMERKFGKYAIHNLALYIIGAYIIGYLFEFIGVADAINLNPYRIFHGEIWRIITWIFIPPQTSGGGLGFIFVLIMLVFYYSLAQNLERAWGAFRFNLYIFSGIIMTIIGAIIFYAVTELTVMRDLADSLKNLSESEISTLLSATSGDSGITTLNLLKSEYYSRCASYFSTYYINLSIFLAFAACFPNMQVLLYFIIPIKIKWMAYLDVIILLFEVVQYVRARMWVGVIAIFASLLNFIVFFLATRDMQRVSPKEIHRKRVYRKQVDSANQARIHQCAICGITSEDDETMEFRYCSKCAGNYEYCKNHLFTHEHIK